MNTVVRIDHWKSAAINKPQVMIFIRIIKALASVNNILIEKKKKHVQGPKVTVHSNCNLKI